MDKVSLHQSNTVDGVTVTGFYNAQYSALEEFLFKFNISTFATCVGQMDRMLKSKQLGNNIAL